MWNRIAMFARLNACGANIFGALAPLVVPPLHIGFTYYFWQEFARYINKELCNCSCWDTVFKGSYESGIASYKHMYFNATTNTLKIWCTIVVGIIAFYETVKHLSYLGLQGLLRWSMMILFTTAVFSHYYSWWVYINYWNDDFYGQWYHQLFFTITELVSTVFVVHLANKHNAVTRRKVLTIVGIAMLHILAGSWDQFVTNVIKGEGRSHQVLRDLGFMIPDILHLFIPLYLLKETGNVLLPGNFLRDSDLRKDIMYVFVWVFFGLCICSFL